MKKLLSLILSLCMICLLIPAVAEGDVTGDWYVHLIKNSDTEYDAAAIGMAFHFILNADGTASMEMGDETKEGSWSEADGKITVTFDDMPAEGALEGDSLVLSAEGTVMTLTREPVEAIVLAAVNPNAAAEDFEGEWTCVYLEAAGLVMGAEATGEEAPVLTVADGKITLSGGSFSELLGSEAVEMPYADGKMGYELAFGELSITFTLEMLEDGMLAFRVGMGEETTSLYFVRAAAESPAA